MIAALAGERYRRPYQAWEKGPSNVPGPIDYQSHLRCFPVKLALNFIEAGFDRCIAEPHFMSAVASPAQKLSCLLFLVARHADWQRADFRMVEGKVTHGHDPRVRLGRAGDVSDPLPFRRLCGRRSGLRTRRSRYWIREKCPL